MRGCNDAFFQHLSLDEVEILLLFITCTELTWKLDGYELER